MINIFDTLTEEYDAWYDSKERSSLYESEGECLRPMVERALLPIFEIGVGTENCANRKMTTLRISPAY